MIIYVKICFEKHCKEKKHNRIVAVNAVMQGIWERVRYSVSLTVTVYIW